MTFLTVPQSDALPVHPGGHLLSPAADSGCAGPVFCGILTAGLQAAPPMLFEKRSRKLHSFFLFLLYDMIEMKSIFEEGDCVLWLRS